MALYRLTERDIIERTTDGAQIPIAEENADYQAYLAWIGAGNLPDPAPVPTVTDETFGDDPRFL
jgi:hypothetical protein